MKIISIVLEQGDGLFNFAVGKHTTKQACLNDEPVIASLQLNALHQPYTLLITLEDKTQIPIVFSGNYIATCTSPEEFG